MVELNIGQPGVPILVFCNGRIIFFLGCVGKTVGGGNTIDVNPLSQPVNALAVRKIRSSELKVSLRGGDGKLTALSHALRRQYKSVGNNRRTRACRSACEALIGVGREVEELAIDIIAGHKLPFRSGNLAYSFRGEGSIPPRWGSIGYSEQDAIGNGRLRMQCDAKSKRDITQQGDQSLL